MRAPRSLHALFALAAAALALLSLAGWIAGAPMLTTLVHGRPALSPMTALMLLLGAAGIAQLVARPRLAFRLAAVEVACGITIVVAQATGVPGQGRLPHAWWC